MAKQPKPDAQAAGADQTKLDTAGDAAAGGKTEPPAAVAAADPGTAGAGAREASAQVTEPVPADVTMAASGAGAAASTGITLIVTSLQPVRWRAGRQFGREPVMIPMSDLTEAETASILADPVLSVQVV
jgi:hypothetical protein